MKENKLSQPLFVKSEDIYKAFGYKQHSFLRQSIRENIDLFESFGELRCTNGETTKKGGRPSQSYLLNTEHLLVLVSIIRKPLQESKARIIKSIIDVYTGESLISAMNSLASIDIDCQEDMWVYVAREDGCGSYKVGISNDPERRIKELNTGNPNQLTLVHCYQARDGFKSEKLAHEIFKDSRVRGEWFSSDIDLSKLPSYKLRHSEEDPNCDCVECRDYGSVMDSICDKGDMHRDQFISLAIEATGLSFDVVAKNIDALHDTGVIQFAEIIGKSQILSLENKAV